MREKLLEAIRQHVIEEYPKEACGVIIQKGNKQTYMPCHNDADDPLNTFVMRECDYRSAEQEGEVIMFIHSHPDVPVLIPSEMDRI